MDKTLLEIYRNIQYINSMGKKVTRIVMGGKLASRLEKYIDAEDDPSTLHGFLTLFGVPVLIAWGAESSLWWALSMGDFDD
jgi:hypothetical protein